MSIRHGIQFGVETNSYEDSSRVMIWIKATGKLSHQDYEVMVPALDAAISKVEKAKIYILLDATEFEGWELQAMWDDFRFGLSHYSEFVKIAIVGHQPWQALSAKIGNWFVHGDVQYFESLVVAKTWLEETL